MTTVGGDAQAARAQTLDNEGFDVRRAMLQDGLKEVAVAVMLGR